MNFKLLMVVLFLHPVTATKDWEYPAIEWWPPSMEFPNGRPIMGRDDCLALSRFKIKEYRGDGGRVTHVDCARIGQIT